ncbi:hypothetical protein HYS72_03655 [Candidatus Pacearchaeota archaeon]|nr:hypothetical protein [Candidatus Pacearchaeota archaeon]MBI2057260.1 hypothetical protein [Candidatus Pacearchaeota archaeon]
METKTIENTFEVKEGRTIITIPHLESKVDFVHPAFKGNYENVGRQMREAGLIEPTPEQTASLVYSAFENLDNKYAKDIKQIMKDNWVWMFNTIKYIPNKGALIQKPDKDEVFVPFGYKIGTQSSLELSENPFVVGLFGKEGAEKIARVADKYSNKPYVYSFENVDNEIVRKSALSRYWGFDGGLNVGGYGWNDGDVGHAFGISPSEKA